MKKGIPKTELVVVVDDVRSVFNVGSFFRTSDAVGVSKIYLGGCTPTPVDRFNRPRKDLAKTALGSEQIIPWEYVKDIKKLLLNLKKEGYKILALELSERAIDYKKAKLTAKNILVVGNEVDGVDKNILSLADEIIQIPMKGKKESLNVGVSYGIAAYRLLDK